MIYESDEAMDAITCGNVGGALNGEHSSSPVWPKRGARAHRFCAFPIRGGPDRRLGVLGHGLAPVSASGGVTGDDHADEDDAAHDEEGGHAAATPDA